MKFEFSLAVKAAPMVDCHISLDCSTDELALLINDPAYQGLVKKLIDEVSFKPQQNSEDQHRQHRPNHATSRQQRHDCQERQRMAVQKTIKTINDRMDALRRNGKPGWGEL